MSPYFQAGDLFSLEDLQIIQDLRLVLTKIREIISAPDFGSNHNDQSLVEICITRITSGECPFELFFLNLPPGVFDPLKLKWYFVAERWLNPLISEGPILKKMYQITIL